jgi:hypothetical protein
MFKNWLKWQKGRQNTGYEKMLVCESYFPVPFDIYILRFNKGNEIPEHTDKVMQGFKHYRMNIILKHSIEGGDFVCNNCIINNKYVKFFRPDINIHSVTKIIKGTRYVLSIGFLKKEK